MSSSTAGVAKLPEDLLESLAAPTACPGGGSAAAVVVAFAAALVEKAARLSRDSWPHSDGTIAQAQALRRRAMPLAERDAEVYSAAIAALSIPSNELGPALSRAAAVPLLIAEAAADVAALAREVAERGTPEFRGEAVIAAVLADAAAKAAMHLVEINLASTREDERVLVARALADSAHRAADAALAVGP
jgi:formiminotetrahydrofolate cyclodeaminase